MFFLFSLIIISTFELSQQYVTLLTGKQLPIPFYINNYIYLGVSGSGYLFDANGEYKLPLTSSFMNYDSTVCIKYNSGSFYTSYQNYIYVNQALKQSLDITYTSDVFSFDFISNGSTLKYLAFIIVNNYVNFIYNLSTIKVIYTTEGAKDVGLLHI